MTVILLAAGLSERMGKNKLLLPFRGKPLILSTLEAVLSYTENVIVITGHERNLIEEAVESYNVRTLYAENYMEGQKASTMRGVAAIDNTSFAIIPGDLPLITKDDFLETEKGLKKHSISRASYSGVPGHPVMFRKEHKERLLRFDGSMKEYLAQNDTIMCKTSIGSIFDTDTPDRYKALIEQFG